MKIGLFDPSLKNNFGQQSTNSGDAIISDAVVEIISNVFHLYDLFRVSTHCSPSIKIVKELNHCDHVFVGGSNLLSSDIATYNQWKLNNSFLAQLLYPNKRNILLGVGWWQYQDYITPATCKYYRKHLNHKNLHSVRDSYTRDKMQLMGFDNVINTSCPTLWNLHNKETNRKKMNINDCIFTLTDYAPNPDSDTVLIETILNSFSGHIYFFVQGTQDEEYLKSLSIFNKNRYKFHLIYTLQEFNEILKTDIVFIGTRLHGGARALQLNVETIILEVDNRSTEIRKDINLPSIDRQDNVTLKKWINGEHVFRPIFLDTNSIQKWKAQF
jgi:polysaccharide pyruvyl transferase WcaK-like protein